MGGRTLEARVQLSDADLRPAAGLAGEGSLPRAEAEARRAAIAGYVAERLTLTNDGAPCDRAPGELALVDKAAGYFAVVPVRFTCARSLGQAALVYRLFFDLDPRHQAMLTLRGPSPRQEVLTAARDTLHLARTPSLAAHVADFLRLGATHIWTGYDHLAFLAALLLAIGWAAPRRALRSLVAVVTAFTVSHSLTLGAAALGWLRLPVRPVEAIIALSIVWVAGENLLRREPPRHRAAVAFGFGLVHGLGFASVLAETGLPPGALAPALIAFNLGVELGQLAVVLALAPLLGYLGRTAASERRLRTVGSVLVTMLGLFWLAERLLGRSWLGGVLG